MKEDGTEFEGFVDLGENMEDIHDPKVQPTGSYDLTVQSAKVVMAEDENQKKYPAKLALVVDFDGIDDAAPIFHNCALPKPGDDKKKKDFKLRMLKKTYKLFDVQLNPNGFNSTDLIGARASSVPVDLIPEQTATDGSGKKYQEQNRINLNSIKV